MKKRLFPALLALVLALTMLSVGVFASGDPNTPGSGGGSGSGGTTTTTPAGTEADPIIIAADTSALEDGKYYKLTGDVTLTAQITVANGVTAYLDLASGTLTAPSGKYAISVKAGGILTINGTDGTVAGSTLGALTNDGGTVTINGGKFTSGWRITVKNQDGTNNAQGKMTVNSGTFTCTANPMDQAIQNFCDLTINGGDFSGKVVTWQEVGTGYSDYGTTKITGGTFNQDVLVALSTGDNGNGAADKMPTLTIDGSNSQTPPVFHQDVGFFEGNNASEGAKPVAQANGAVSIKGATVKGDVYNGSKGTVEIEDATIEGKITNCANTVDGTAGDGAVSIKNSTVSGTIDTSVGIVSGCTDSTGTPIENVVNSNTSLKVEKSTDTVAGFPLMKITGMKDDCLYLIRVSTVRNNEKDEKSVLLLVKGSDVTNHTYSFNAKVGTFITVREYNASVATGTIEGADILTQRTDVAVQ